MAREITNPNTSTTPRPITAAELARVAKTGCTMCHGAGRVVIREKAHGADLKGGDPKGAVCRCVAKLLVGRLDVVERNGAICWAGKKPAEAA